MIILPWKKLRMIRGEEVLSVANLRWWVKDGENARNQKALHHAIRQHSLLMVLCGYGGLLNCGGAIWTRFLLKDMGEEIIN